MGDTTTPQEALKRLGESLTTYEQAVQTCVEAPLYQHEYDLYVDLSYNIGAESFCRSTVVKKLNQYDYKGACDAILLWNRAGQHDCRTSSACKGLWTRRLEAHKKCLSQPPIIAQTEQKSPAQMPQKPVSSTQEGEAMNPLVVGFTAEFLILQVIILLSIAAVVLVGLGALKGIKKAYQWIKERRGEKL